METIAIEMAHPAVVLMVIFKQSLKFKDCALCEIYFAPRKDIRIVSLSFVRLYLA